VRTVTCRCCGVVHSPAVGKPGYIDERPDCLFEKRAAFIPKPSPSAEFLPILEFVDTEADIERLANKMRRVFEKANVPDVEINATVRRFIELARKLVRETIALSEPED
jgi:hypothetical protein